MYHIPVLLHESIEGLAIKPGGTYVDLTFGGGSHSKLILENLTERGRLLAFDRDTDAQKNAINDPRFTLIDQDYRFMKNYLKYHKAIPVDGILADLGISSHQIDDAERGFSTRFEGPLDMRMNKRQEITASDIVNTYSAEKLQDILSRYGEVQNARTLANTIVANRKGDKLTVSGFKEMIKSCIPAMNDFKYLAQVFQALRIEVNGELKSVEEALKQTLQVLKPGGRLVVISYHSLEDRMIKSFIKFGNFSGEAEKDFFGRYNEPFRIITKKPVVPAESELAANNRSRSAKLRIAELN
jgi:16S rRNA (cytosine1402-N4)-methyltransferase